MNARLKLNCPKGYTNDTLDFSKTYFSLFLDKNYDPTSNGIIFVTLSEKVSQTTSNYDVLGFYLTFILVIGKFLKSFIEGDDLKVVMTEMPEPEAIMNLCEGIKISRYRQDFVKEEHLYYVLIDLMRSPEILKSITKSSIRKLKEKALLEEKMKAE